MLPVTSASRDNLQWWGRGRNIPAKYLDIYTDIYTAASNFINISKYFLSRFSLVSVSCLFISSFIYSFLQHTSSLAAKWEEVTVCQLPKANLSWQLLCWWSCPNILIAICQWYNTFMYIGLSHFEPCAYIDFYQPTYEPNAVCWPISPRECHFS